MGTKKPTERVVSPLMFSPGMSVVRSRLALSKRTGSSARPPKCPFPADKMTRALRHKVAHIARATLGKKRLYHLGKSYRWDCSGFVSYVYAHFGFQLIGDGVRWRRHNNGVFRIYRVSRYLKGFHRRRIPCVGDVVFWNYTYDVNRDGKLNDRWTHVGIVEKVDADGTATYIHKAAAHGIIRGKMNLLKPRTERTGSGKRINYWIRNRRHGKHLASSLWTGFATIIKRPLPLHLNHPNPQRRRISRLLHTTEGR